MSTLPARSGIGLKARHYSQLIENPTATGWLEVHPENYMGAGGPPHRYLGKLREHYPLSMHGVGMSLGSAQGLDPKHLSRLRALVDRYQPEQVSEHLSWSHWNGVFLNDLLPMPYTKESLAVVSTNIDKVQNALGRRILIENPSTYIDFERGDYSEPEFFRALAKHCDCGILLDINNVFVSAFNNGFDPIEYLDNFPLAQVGEIHLAGHTLTHLDGERQIRIDDHGSEVITEVWQLYEYSLSLLGKPVATLIEWDTKVPELEVLLAESQKADSYLQTATESLRRTALS